jgi:hypothetical protein
MSSLASLMSLLGAGSGKDDNFVVTALAEAAKAAASPLVITDGKVESKVEVNLGILNLLSAEEVKSGSTVRVAAGSVPTAERFFAYIQSIGSTDLKSADYVSFHDMAATLGMPRLCASYLAAIKTFSVQDAVGVLKTLKDSVSDTVLAVLQPTIDAGIAKFLVGGSAASVGRELSLGQARRLVRRQKFDAQIYGSDLEAGLTICTVAFVDATYPEVTEESKLIFKELLGCIVIGRINSASALNAITDSPHSKGEDSILAAVAVQKRLLETRDFGKLAEQRYAADEKEAKAKAEEAKIKADKEREAALAKFYSAEQVLALKVGDQVDAIDFQGKPYCAVITEQYVAPKETDETKKSDKKPDEDDDDYSSSSTAPTPLKEGEVRVHFGGFDKRYDEPIAADAKRIFPLGTLTDGKYSDTPRQAPRVGCGRPECPNCGGGSRAAPSTTVTAPPTTSAMQGPPSSSAMQAALQRAYISAMLGGGGGSGSGSGSGMNIFGM